MPEEICNLHRLEYFYADFNDLNGPIPTGIFNLSTLIELVLNFNHLIGNLPSKIGDQLPNLNYLDLSWNNFSGVIPVSIGNCSRLSFLHLGHNQFINTIPKSLGNLEYLHFLTSLTNCKSLKVLIVAENPLNGIIPNTIGNLSSSLQKFYASVANITGPIPREIGNLSSLITVSLEDNQLSGGIPSSMQQLRNLQLLSLDQNKIGGNLDSLCQLHKLSGLFLDENQVSGTIPNCFGNITSLRNLYLRENLLTSTIPMSLWNLKDLIVFNLASNSFNGSLPPEIGNLKATITIDLSGNHISGAIPNTLGALLNLQNLSFANNQLEGSLPESLGNMVSLTSLNLSHNYLSGLIPKSLEAISSLQVFDVSSNYLVGEIPSGGCFRNFTSKSFISNAALCGDPRFEVPPCKISKKHRLYGKKLVSLILILAAIFILVIVALACIFLVYLRKIKVPSPQDVPVVASMERISYYELLHATNQLGESNLLGSGSFGSVYKGILNDGKVVAIKVFNLQLEGSLRHFDAECKVLCNLRHRNLVKVISSCSNQDFKALVLVYMPNGSLETWLYSHHLFLNMSKRLNIMIDVAYALQYLHQEYLTPVIHCDLKPSNILLDENLVGHVSDFGITKFLRMDESSALTKTLATIGYIAPEYGREGLVSKACDVFSYGILLMEVFTAKRPNDESFGENLSLKSWVRDSMSDSIVEVIDPKLFREERSYSHELIPGCVSMIMEVALNCVCESPKERLTISEIVDSLKKIERRYISFHRHGGIQL
ncbi:OLC1v1029176C2 [Oldenlandia corymbosa var. corymbosa]|uniref:non-specific serine/threonine protein kinase n=1 Tax=Oldenlandia corymbosa var. corymbosa TaxID=529605 RepID=A0AAV1CG99_OLDCO|nr:OLC1v1029176C2 [Oldenlandia corymbosa var. corymbosa]